MRQSDGAMDTNHDADKDRTRTTEEIGMLGENDAIANVAVRNLETARKFYEGVLGLTQVGAEGQEVIVFKSGNSRINVYRSQYAGTNQATALTWSVGQHLQSIARALKSKGVPFEHYDLPGMRREDDIHIFGDLQVVWFKDPDGNILSIGNR
jgi:catechol 2,3-dioxygenase-like lactoylglutathione lyase family enzyme